MEQLFEKLTEPKNRYDQVEAVAFHALDNPIYFEALRYLPERCKAAALNMFDRGEVDTYHARVIRAALRQYAAAGQSFINTSMKPFTDLELTLCEH